nr:hypothetical protein [Tanacetum cinerariifolium]
GVLYHEDFMAQLKEIKRLTDLKAEKEKFKESLKKKLNSATVRAQTSKMVEYEEKKAKMLEEYNKCIYEKADKLPITKIHYRVSSSQDPTM